MEWPKREELFKCHCYSIMSKGYAYWNPETKALFEFDRRGLIIKNSSTDRDPADGGVHGYSYIRSFDGEARRPALDSLGIEFLYENIQDEVLTNEKVIAFAESQNTPAHKEEVEQNLKDEYMKELQNMTPEQLAREFPEVYQEVYQEAFQRGVQKERARVNSWLDSGLNMWQIREGILKTELTYQEALKNEMDAFWGSIDSKLKGTHGGRVVALNQGTEQKEDYYSKLEAKEFYAQVDSMSKN